MVKQTKQKGVKVKCPKGKCGYCWRYKGELDDVISCPRCHTSMSKARAIKRARGQPLTERKGIKKS